MNKKRVFSMPQYNDEYVLLCRPSKDVHSPLEAPVVRVERRDGHELRPREPVHEQVTVTGHDI